MQLHAAARGAPAQRVGEHRAQCLKDPKISHRTAPRDSAHSHDYYQVGLCPTEDVLAFALLLVRSFKLEYHRVGKHRRCLEMELRSSIGNKPQSDREAFLEGKLFCPHVPTRGTGYFLALPLYAHRQNTKMTGKWGGGSHAEDNALAFVQTVEGEAAPSQHHVQKRRKKQRGLEIMFDPQAHK